MTQQEPAHVLITGDRQDAFTKTSWADIETSYRNVADAHAPESADPAARADLVIPLLLDDKGDASSPEFKADLLKTLSTKNVIAIISTGTGPNASALFKHLGPIPTPVLVVVASNRELLRQGSNGVIRYRPNTLRLIPNNDQQADAIIAKAISLSKPITLFSPALADSYAGDLLRSLKNKLADASGVTYRTAQDLQQFLGAEVGVFVGYLNDWRKVRERAQNMPKHLILSDGCYDSEYWEQTGSSGSNNVWLTLPPHDVSTLAKDAYNAALKIWREHLRHPNLPVDHRLAMPATLIQSTLETFGNGYHFSGPENTGSGYRVCLMTPRIART